MVMFDCMDHARRKFFEAGENHPDVIHAPSIFRNLYIIEPKARDHQLTHQQRQASRMAEAKPIWERFKDWLLE